MPMYNLLGYSKNYRKTIGSLYNYYRHELTNDQNNNRVPIPNYRANLSGTSNVILAIP